MRGPMLRFVIVAALLFLLVIFYATRLGDGEEPAAGSDAPPGSGTESSPSLRETPVAGTVAEDGEGEDWFPDLRSRNDLPGINLGTAIERTTFDCDIDELLERMALGKTLDGEEGEAFIMNMLESLAVSGDAELQLAGARLSVNGDLGLESLDDRDRQMVLLERAYQTDPMRPHVLWHIAMACEDWSSSFCSDPQLQATTLTVLGGNGGYWAYVANQRYLEGDDQGALEALRQAAAAPDFDNYFVEDVRMLQRALSLIPDISYPAQALGAYMLAQTNQRQGIVLTCVDEAPSRPEWFDACLSLADRYEADGRTVWQQRAGAGMQVKLYEAAGRSEEAAAARERRREVRGVTDLIDEDIAAVMLTDERVMGLFLEELNASDEVSAGLFVRDEVERLKQQSDYHPCPPSEFAD